MGLLHTVTTWIGSAWSALTGAGRRVKSAGERVFTNMLLGGGTFASFGGWSQDRYGQVQRFKAWPYIAIRAIYEQVALMPPQVAWVHHDPQAIEQRRQGKKLLSRHARTKALANIQSHEELEPVDNDHKLLKLLNNPNGPDVGWTFWAKLLMYLELTGNAYIWLAPSKGGLLDGSLRPAEMWVIPSHWIRPFSTPDKLVAWYEVRPMGGPGVKGMLRFPADEIIHIAYPNPIDAIDGWSPMTAMAEWIDTAESMDASQWFSFKNGINPSLILELDAEKIQDPDQDTQERVRAKVREKYQGERRTGDPLVLPTGVTAKPWSTSPKEMDYTTSGDQKRDWILAGFKTGKSIVGISEDVNFASAIAARANFILSTIKPKLTLLGQILTEKLASRFPGGRKLCVYWPDMTPDDPVQHLAENVAYLAAGVKTVNEVRSEIGLEAYPHGGDDPMPPMGSAPVPWVTGEDLDPLELPKGFGQSAPDENGHEETEPSAKPPGSRFAMPTPGGNGNGNGKA